VGLLNFWVTHRTELGAMIERHLFLVLWSTLIATAIGLPAGIVAAHRPRIGRPLLAAASIAQTIPSLALLGFLLPLPFIGGIGPRIAIVALILYALLPIVRSTAAGLRSIDRSVIDAGIAMGMTARQLLWLVELPLALPSIVAGIRIATIVGIGTATIAAAIGAGGLGEYIFRGLSMVDSTVILAGAIPAALLALAADGMLTWVERRLMPGRRRLSRAAPVAIAAASLLVVALAAADIGGGRAGGRQAADGASRRNLAAQRLVGPRLLEGSAADLRSLRRWLVAFGRYRIHDRRRQARRRRTHGSRDQLRRREGAG